MDRKLKSWELALMFGLLVGLVSAGWLRHEHKTLADSVIRLHVIANSDSAEDQTLKLAVRDRVLEQAAQLYPENATREEVRQALESRLSALAAAGQAAVEAEGYSYPVTAQLTNCWFPTKEYDSFALPAGNYTALRITIGEGKGQNWWCVAFPPLCVGAASETIDRAVEAGWFTPDQGALIAGSEGYVLKFKAMEWLGELQEFFER